MPALASRRGLFGRDIPLEKTLRSARFGTFVTGLTLFGTGLASFGTIASLGGPPFFRGETACVARNVPLWLAFRAGRRSGAQARQSLAQSAKLAKELGAQGNEASDSRDKRTACALVGMWFIASNYSFLPLRALRLCVRHFAATAAGAQVVVLAGIFSSRLGIHGFRLHSWGFPRQDGSRTAAGCK